MFLFWYPGCNTNHLFDSRWTFNGNFERPTFAPSLLTWSDPARRCHSFVRDGCIEFLSDSFHELAGKTVEMMNME